MKNIFTRKVRGWIYGISIAAVPLLIYFGFIEPEAGALILPLVLAILNLTPEETGDAGR